MTQYYSRVDYTYTSGDRLFTIPFSYIDKQHIKVYINYEETVNYIFNSESQILITEELSENDVVTIQRITNIDERYVTFTNTSMMNKDIQNLSAQQTFNVVQELYDTMASYEVSVQDQFEDFENTINSSISTVLTAAQSVAQLEQSIATATAAAALAAEAAEAAATSATDAAEAIAHVSATNNPHNVTASQIGLGNCDNTSDLNKPISTATQTALDEKLNTYAGLIMLYGGYSVPSGWLVCDGSAVSRTTYAALFTAIGTTFGSGDDSTTFNLPNLIGKYIFGATLVGSTTFATNTATGTQSANHKHSYLAGTSAAIETGNQSKNHTHTYVKGVDGLGLLPIIKY